MSCCFFCFSGILQPHIHYLLVLATSVDVVILGLSFPRSQAGESSLQLYHSDTAFVLFPVAFYYIDAREEYSDDASLFSN